MTSDFGFMWDGFDLTATSIIPLPDGIEPEFEKRFTVKIDFDEILYWVHSIILWTRGDGDQYPHINRRVHYHGKLISLLSIIKMVLVLAGIDMGNSLSAHKMITVVALSMLRGLAINLKNKPYLSLLLKQKTSVSILTLSQILVLLAGTKLLGD